ncbi:MAG: AsmA-like C-terminal region-containing protein, partial [Pseudomonadota bacterium]
SLRIDFRKGRFGLWSVADGLVHYPQLSPAGADMMVGISGTGPARNLAQIVSDSRLQLEARSGFNPANVSGDGEMRFELTRPAIENAPASSYRYVGEGTIRDGGLDRAVGTFGLTESDAGIRLDQTGIEIDGFGALAGAPVRFRWSYPFGVEDALAQLTATSLFTPDTLNAFGIVGRAYLSGEVPVQIAADLNGTQIKSLEAELDLTTARLDVAEVNWVKPAGAEADAVFRIDQDASGPKTFAALQASDAKLEGVLELEPNGRLVSADLARAFLKDRADVRGTVRRNEENDLVFQLRGAFLDLSRLVPNMSQLGGSGTPAARMGGVRLDAVLDRLTLREGFDMLGANMQLISSAQGLQTFEASGLTQTGADFTAAFDSSGLGDPSFLVTCGDASFLASVFLGTDALEDGELEMSGTLATGDLPSQVRIQVKDGRLRDAPILTQLLSLASIRGVSDTLSGEGVLFTEIDVPLAIAGTRYDIVGARASGPALGLTANGFVNTDGGDIDIDGVLVPSFGVNSALGGIPLIGDLFVSRKGEGVVSLRYGIEGTLERAQVSVNPLSAITPGVLRRIFENPAEAPLPEEGAPIEDE